MLVSKCWVRLDRGWLASCGPPLPDGGAVTGLPGGQFAFLDRLKSLNLSVTYS